MSDSPPLLVLPADCDLDWVDSIHETASQLVAAHGALRFDVSGLRRITTPAIQLMLAAGIALADRGARLEIVGRSEILDTAMADLGLSETFEKWSTRSDA